jgi:mucin-19
MRARRSVLLLIVSVVALVSLAGAQSALAAGPYSMTISSAATSGMQCNSTNCYPLSNGANLNVGDLENDMNAALYNGFYIGEFGGGSNTGTITIENSISDAYPLTLQPDSGDVVIDDTTDAGDTATINTLGLTVYAPISGPASGSSSLTVEGGPATLYDSTSGSTLGTLDFADGANLAWGSGTLSANSIDITGDLSGDGSGTNTVAFDAPGGTTLDPGAYGYAGIDSMTVDGPAAIEGTFNGDGNDRDETFDGAVTLNGDTTINGHANLDSTIDGAHSLNVIGSATLDGAVGSVAQPLSLTVSGATTIDTTSVSTVNGQSYGATTLLASPTLSGSNIAFDSTIDGAQSLTVYNTGQALFDGAVGGSVPLTAVTLSSGAGNTELTGNVTTSGPQSYSQPVTLDAPVTLSAPGSTIDLADAFTTSHTLTLSNGTLELNDAGNAFSAGGGVQINSGATADFVSGAFATGMVTLNGGTLAWDSANTSVPNAIDVSNGGTLNIGDNNVTLSSGTGGSNAGTIIKSGTGELTLAAGSGASYGAGVEVASGSLTVTGSIVTPITVDSGTTLTCDGGTLGGAVTNSGGTLTGAPSSGPTSVAATGADGVVSVAFTPGTNNCYPVSYTANELGAAASASGTASPLTFDGLALGQSYSFTLTETNPLGSATGASSNTLLLPAAPTVSITSPTQGASYTQGQVLDAAYTCTEASGGPGIASCTGTVAAGAALDTSTAGSHTLTVIATSLDGETASESFTYTVTAPTPSPSPSPAPSSGGSSAPPSSAFTIKTLTGAASGALKLTLSLPGAGSVKVTETVAGVGTVTASAHGSRGTCKLTTTPSKKLQAKLRRKHVKRVTVKIAFTPNGGTTRTVSKTVSL